MIDNWVQSHSGLRIYPLDPKPESFSIEDCAHALSMIVRFGGHAKGALSVAQHCVSVSRSCDSKDALWGLLHDAAEFVLLDIPKPLKADPRMAFYREAEAGWMRVICDLYGLPHQMPESVREADERWLATEAKALMGNTRDWVGLARPYDFSFNVWSQSAAEFMFLRRFYDLCPTERGAA